MSRTFYVRLVLFFLDGSTTTTVVDIVEAIELDTQLKNAAIPKEQDSLIDLHYTTLRELPSDDEAET